MTEMTEQRAIQLAIEYQKEHHQSVKISKLHRIGQDLIDAMVEAHGMPDPLTAPDWMRPSPHWVVLFDRENNMVPNEDVISVYDDGVVTDMPIM
jgi:hypothetical protein